MARIRSIKPEFWTSEQVLGLKPVTRLLFIGMWNFADDYGRMPLAPRSIKAQVMPEDPVTADDVRAMLFELDAAGLIIIYSVEGKEYLEVTGWSHQKIDKPHKPKYPGPYTEQKENVAEPSPNIPGSPAEPSPLDRIGEEKKRKKETRAEPAYSPEFEKFWIAYPRTPVMAKKMAWPEWQKLPPEDQSAALAAVAPFKEWLAKQKDHPVVHACRFLSQRRFDGFKNSPAALYGFVLTDRTPAQVDAWCERPPVPLSAAFIRSRIANGHPVTVPSEYPPGYEPKAA